MHVQAGPGSQASPVPPASVSRTALVRAGHQVIGHVTAWVSITDLLWRLSAKTGVDAAALVDGRVVGGPLQGSAITAPAATPAAVRVDGNRYRVLRQPLGRGVSAVLVVPYSKIESSVFHRELPTVAAGAVTLLALAILAALAVPRLTALRTREDAGDWRRPVALVGDVAVAAHDPDALLPVILETALAATDADGGAVVWEGNEIASLGDTTHATTRPLPSARGRASPRSWSTAPLPSQARLLGDEIRSSRGHSSLKGGSRSRTRGCTISSGDRPRPTSSPTSRTGAAS